MSQNPGIGFSCQEQTPAAAWKTSPSPICVTQIEEHRLLAKEKNLRKDVFDKAAFTVQMIPTKEKDEDTGLTTKRASYIAMIQKQGSVQLSTGSASIDCLIRFSKKFTLRRANEDGTKTPTIKKSAQGVMRYTTLDGDSIWLAAIPRYRGGVAGYFSCVLPERKACIEQWTQ